MRRTPGPAGPGAGARRRRSTYRMALPARNRTCASWSLHHRADRQPRRGILSGWRQEPPHQRTRSPRGADIGAGGRRGRIWALAAEEECPRPVPAPLGGLGTGHSARRRARRMPSTSAGTGAAAAGSSARLRQPGIPTAAASRISWLFGTPAGARTPTTDPDDFIGLVRAPARAHPYRLPRGCRRHRAEAVWSDHCPGGRCRGPGGQDLSAQAAACRLSRFPFGRRPAVRTGQACPRSQALRRSACARPCRSPEKGNGALPKAPGWRMVCEAVGGARLAVKKVARAGKSSHSI